MMMVIRCDWLGCKTCVTAEIGDPERRDRPARPTEKRAVEFLMEVVCNMCDACVLLPGREALLQLMY